MADLEVINLTAVLAEMRRSADMTEETGKCLLQMASVCYTQAEAMRQLAALFDPDVSN